MIPSEVIWFPAYLHIYFFEIIISYASMKRSFEPHWMNVCYRGRYEDPSVYGWLCDVKPIKPGCKWSLIWLVVEERGECKDSVQIARFVFHVKSKILKCFIFARFFPCQKFWKKSFFSRNLWIFFCILKVCESSRSFCRMFSFPFFFRRLHRQFVVVYFVKFETQLLMVWHFFDVFIFGCFFDKTRTIVFDLNCLRKVQTMYGNHVAWQMMMQNEKKYSKFSQVLFSGVSFLSLSLWIPSRVDLEYQSLCLSYGWK